MRRVRPLEQLRAQALLQRGEVAARRRVRQAQLLRGLGKAAQVDGLT